MFARFRFSSPRTYFPQRVTQKGWSCRPPRCSRTRPSNEARPGAAAAPAPACPEASVDKGSSEVLMGNSFAAFFLLHKLWLISKNLLNNIVINLYPSWWLKILKTLRISTNEAGTTGDTHIYIYAKMNFHPFLAL